MVTLEHVQNLEVKGGQEVTAGQKIGRVSTAGFEGTGYGFSEISVWRGGATEKDIIKVCPFAALTQESQNVISSQISQFVNDWESFIGKNVYAEESWPLPGCLFEQLTEYQALHP
jgi:hypothetical protein